ncbi:hypothetical protein [Szabonella alba]|uniref:Uncharacterized protein n=1 Tax=Szabonella alba TaxID=2804194 RepID=A0A8K0XZR9_9RHOB|nr:hypothetical protein [Szabonella alba]MBL4917086.1 hypothetical protein [Szabonella alba]
MVELSDWTLSERSDYLYFHFDVKGHALKLETFIQTAESARRVIEALDATFFGGSLDYEVVVVPPEDGSFLSKLALWVVGGTSAVFAFINTSTGAAFVEGLTGHPPSHWAAEAGKGTRAILDEVGELVAPSAEPEDEGAKRSEEEAACRETARITVELTRAILESSPERLQKVGMEIGDLPEALDARADFYLACIEDREVKRIGFTPDDDFPIPRNSFPSRAVKPSRKEPDESAPEWISAVESIYVTSPNWDEEDQKARQWKGKDQIRRDCYFVIEDREFWQLVKRKSLHVEVLDRLRVQWAYQMVDGRPKNRRVLRVLEFNGDKLADPLDHDALSAILGDYSAVEASRGQPSLFDKE